MANTISSSTSYSASASKGLSGLVSGLDTEAMVEKMLAGTQNKIDKQEASKTRLEWKQESYRSIITQLLSFQSKFFDYLNPSTNLMSQGFFNSMQASTLSNAIKVAATSDASSGKTTIDRVISLATSRKEESADRVTKGIEGDLDVSKIAADTEIDITLDGQKKTISLKAGLTEAELKADIQSQIDTKFGAGNLKVGGASGKLSLMATTKDSSGNVVEDMGRKITVSSITSTDKTKVSASKAAFEALGLRDGQSNKMVLTDAVKNISFTGGALAGDNFKFTINGVQIEAKSDESVSAIISRINESDAGVRVTYSAVSDKFIIEADESGAGRDITFSQEQGNLLSVMFGVGSSGTVSSTAVAAKDSIAGSVLSDADRTKIFTDGGEFSITVGDKTATIKIAGNPDYATETDPDAKKQLESTILSEINRQLTAEFGTKSNFANVSMELKDDGSFGLNVKNGLEVTFDGGATDDLGALMGFGAGTTNAFDTASSALKDFGYEGNIMGVEIQDGETMNQFAARLQDKLRLTDAAAEVTVGDDGAITIRANSEINITGSSELMGKLFGAKDGFTLNSGGTDTRVLEEGTNAVLEINGVMTERSSNSFEINGLNIELLEVSDEPIVIEATRDTEQIFEGIKSFVDEYNKMIEELNGLIKQDPEYRDYAPLTEAQKKEMSEKEIEQWEEKAKTGLLRNDDTISTMLSNMRTMMYTKPADAKYALYDFGIETSDTMKDYGKLVIDETKLKAMIESDAGELEKLFRSEDGGLANEMNKIIDQNAKMSSGSPGVLVSLAGVKGMSTDSENVISRQIRDIKDKIESLKSLYESEKTRYWNQFNAMEKLISQMNQQSTWLTSQFS